MRSWPEPAAIWEVIWPITSAVLMWSTVTLTPTCWPQSRANPSNHSSWLGTKWLHMRMRRSPDSADAGSSRMVDAGAPTSSGRAVVGDASSSSPPHADSSGGASALAAMPCRNPRRVMLNGRATERIVLPPDRAACVSSSSNTAAVAPAYLAVLTGIPPETCRQAARRVEMVSAIQSASTGMDVNPA